MLLEQMLLKQMLLEQMLLKQMLLEQMLEQILLKIIFSLPDRKNCKNIRPCWKKFIENRSSLFDPNVGTHQDGVGGRVGWQRV